MSHLIFFEQGTLSKADTRIIDKSYMILKILVYIIYSKNRFENIQSQLILEKVNSGFFSLSFFFRE